MRYIFICVIANLQNSLVVELLSWPFYRWKNRLRYVSKSKAFSISNFVFSPLSCQSPIVNHTNAVGTEMKIIIHRKDNENVMISKIFKILLQETYSTLKTKILQIISQQLFPHFEPSVWIIYMNHMEMWNQNMQVDLIKNELAIQSTIHLVFLFLTYS